MTVADRQPNGPSFGVAVPLPYRAARWPLRVLAIESASHLAAESADTLLRQGIEVRPYSDGLSALLGIGDDQPDLILAPTDMRGVGLVEFVEAIRSWNDIPVLVGIGHDAFAYEVAGSAIEQGAGSLISLPFLANDLVVAIRNLGFTSHRQRPATLLRSGLIELDPQAFRVRIGADPVPLTLREFKLFHFLMLEGNRVVDVSELANGIEHDGETTVAGVRVAMNRMRRKLEQCHPRGASILETVTGQGYRFSPIG